MKRALVLLSLLAALSATPLRQAEAAADLCRSVADRDTSGDLDLADGGVGDDRAETITPKVISAPLPLDHHHHTFITPPVRPSPARIFDTAPASRTAPNRSTELALLQCYRC